MTSDIELYLCAGHTISVVPFVLIAPFVSLLPNLVKETAKDAYQTFILYNILSMIFSLILLCVCGTFIGLIQVCLNTIIRSIPTLHSQIEQRQRRTCNLKKWIILGIIIMSQWILCASISYLLYKTTDLSKFMSIVVGSMTSLVGFLTLIMLCIRVIFPCCLNMCVSLGTHSACCYRCLQHCVEPNYTTDIVEIV